MSFKAYLIPSPGADLILKYIHEITEHDRDKVYICGNIVDGIRCTARMCPVIKKSGSHFRLLNADHHHICGCDNNKSRDSVLLRWLNRTGIGTTLDELVESFEPPQKTQRKRRRYVSEITDSRLDTTQDTYVDNRRQKYASRHPRNMKELTILLSRADKKDLYTNYEVGDIYIDGENIRHYRDVGIPTNHKIIVLCRLMTSNMLAKRMPHSPSDKIVLEDAYAFQHHTKGILFLFRPTPTAKNKIFSSFGKNIAICAKWYPHPNIPMAYSSDDVITPSRIYIDDSNVLDR